MKKTLFVLLFHILLALIFTWPLILHLNSLILDRQDGLLITWFLNWSIVHPLNFNANIFFPYKLTLAFSETMLPQAILAAPFVKFFSEPLLAYNLNFLAGFFLTGLSMYLLTGSLLWSVIFTYNPVHLAYAAHLQLFNFWPVIFTVYFLRKRQTLPFLFFFLVSSLTTALFFYFLLLIGGIFFILDKERRFIIKNYLAAISVSVPFLLPYFLVSRQFNYIRPLTDVIHFSLAPQDLFLQFFPGFIFIVLLLRRVLFKKPFLIIALAAFILSFGPALHLVKNTVHFGPLPAIPMPYLIFYYLVPGFSGFRTPSRWILLAFFALCVAVVPKIKKTYISVLIFIIFFLEIFFRGLFPLKYETVPAVKDFPPEQVWLANNLPGASIIQFPIYGWWDLNDVKQETLRMYYSTIHWHPMYNGYSGFSPKEWEERVKWLQKNYPSPEVTNYLKSIGIKIVVDNGKVYEIN